jgi:hypothetical protein
MDMSITPRLSEIDAERLRRARRTSGNPVLVAVTTAALAIDDARFGEAQNLLLDAINGFTPSGAYITDEAHALAMTVRRNLVGHAYQTCALRSCLDLIDAMHLKCKPMAAGERIGRLCHAMAELMAAQRALRAAA